MGGDASAFVEYSISRADLGVTTTLRVQGLVNTGSTVHARFPATSGGAQRYLSADMSAANFPKDQSLLP